MKVIDLLNKIANGEINEDTLIEFDNGYKDYCSVRVFFDRYIMDRENLNCEVEAIDIKKPKTINDIRESYGLPMQEEKKIPEKLGECAYVDGEIAYSWSKSEAILKTRINEIIDYLDYLKSKGDE